jgi:hypothetical protein
MAAASSSLSKRSRLVLVVGMGSSANGCSAPCRASSPSEPDRPRGNATCCGLAANPAAQGV